MSRASGIGALLTARRKEDESRVQSGAACKCHGRPAQRRGRPVTSFHRYPQFPPAALSHFPSDDMMDMTPSPSQPGVGCEQDREQVKETEGYWEGEAEIYIEKEIEWEVDEKWEAGREYV